MKILFLILLIPTIVYGQSNSDIILIGVSDNTALYSEPTTMSDHIFLEKPMPMFAVGYHAPKTDVYKFIKVYHGKKYYYVLINAVKIKAGDEKRLLVLETNPLSDSLVLEYEKYLDMAIDRMDSLAKLERKADSIRRAPIIRKSIEYGLSIIDFNEEVDARTGGISFDAMNCSRTKRIKYLYVTVAAYNDVDDIIMKKEITAIGPIEPLSTGQYKFEEIFFSRVINYLRILQIRIQYFDGTSKILSQKMINEVWDTK